VALPTEDQSVRTLTLPAQVTGPVRYDWLAQAARAAGKTKGLHVACALAWLAALHGRPDVPLTRRTWSAGLCLATLWAKPWRSCGSRAWC